MTAVAHLTALYSAAPVILWVEDSLARDYLTKVWGDPAEVSFLIAGNKSAVTASVAAARQEGITHVFGLVDRDFGYTNQPQWAAPATQVFYLPRHEMENYALDAGAVFGCSLHNRNRNPAELGAELSRLASLQPAWLAYRRVVSEMRHQLLEQFPGVPGLDKVTSVAEAENHIVGSPWFGRLPTRTNHWVIPGQVANAVAVAEQRYSTALVDGNWVSEFSGKEVFRRLRDYVHQPPPRSATPDNDFVKAIGEWQLANGQVPADLLRLRSALRSKVRLPP